jgi:hypothetical protein
LGEIMTDYATQTDDEARESIKKYGQTFFSAQYQNELGIFLANWDDHYKGLKLKDFRQAGPQEDRMLLPGMPPPLDVSRAVTQALAQIWLQFRSDGEIGSGIILEEKVRQCVVLAIEEQHADAEATEALQEDLVTYLTPRLEAKEY